MFNSFGNHKIGIFGSSTSGKTIFLTSLLWHLSEHDSSAFSVGKDAQITDFKFDENKEHNFEFEQYKNTFVYEKRWPPKTKDYTIASCHYSRSDCFFARDISFVDIPGERMSDILLWKSANYTEWVENLHKFWRDNPQIMSIMESYFSDSYDPQKKIEELGIEYKQALWTMLETYLPITPSTYFLGTDGQMLGDENNSDKERAVKERLIWQKGDLVPLPEKWIAAHMEEGKKQERLFKEYKKEVLKPLFSEADSCDNFIFCIDVLNILMSGPALFLQTRQEIKAFIEELAPSKFVKFLNRIGQNPPRVAFIATKSDMVMGEYKDNLACLLKDVTRSLLPSGMEDQCFICSACVSTEMRTYEGQDILAGRNCYNPQEMLDLNCKIPKYWPDNWNIEDYGFHPVAPCISSVHPPEQNNLDRIFEFIIEGVHAK